MGNAMGLMFLISAAEWGFTGVKNCVFFRDASGRNSLLLHVLYL